VAASLDEGLSRIERLMAEAAGQRARIICFPEAYLPGLRGQDFEVYPFGEDDEERALETIARWSRDHGIATIVGMEHARQIAAFVIDRHGTVVGCQTKNQLDPAEDRFYVPGTARQMFEIDGLKFGIAICHEGWRYPETVRWAAVRGAQIVFHPQLTGSVRGPAEPAYYPEAMRMRSRENTIYFASVNYALPFPESATSIIDPSGECIAQLPAGREGVLVHDIDLDRATGLLAKRYAPDRY
jgi:predicted amidohydrolase